MVPKPSLSGLCAWQAGWPEWASCELNFLGSHDWPRLRAAWPQACYVIFAYQQHSKVFFLWWFLKEGSDEFFPIRCAWLIAALYKCSSFPSWFILFRKQGSGGRVEFPWRPGIEWPPFRLLLLDAQRARVEVQMAKPHLMDGFADKRESVPVNEQCRVTLQLLINLALPHWGFSQLGLAAGRVCVSHRRHWPVLYVYHLGQGMITLNFNVFALPLGTLGQKSLLGLCSWIFTGIRWDKIYESAAVKRYICVFIYPTNTYWVAPVCQAHSGFIMYFIPAQISRFT